MQNINILDFILGILLLLGAIRGYSRGFLAQLIGLFGIIVALVLSLKFYKILELYLTPLEIVSDSFISIVALLVTFGLIYISIKLVSSIVQKSIETIGLGFVNRIAGAVLGLLLFLMISSTVLLMINPILDILYPELKEKSVLLEPLTDVSSKVKYLWSENKDKIHFLDNHNQDSIR